MQPHSPHCMHNSYFSRAQCLALPKLDPQRLVKFMPSSKSPLRALLSNFSTTVSEHWFNALMFCWQEQQPTYRPSQYDPNGAGSSVQNNMDSQIPPDSADRQRNMASSNSAAASQFQQQPNSPQSNQSSQRGATPQWSQQQRRWGSDVDLGSLEEWDSD